jgi:PAS domain S-box-containing protein
LTRHRSILDAVPALIVEVNEHRTITLANRHALERWTGIAEGKSAFNDLFRPTDPAGWECILEKTFSSRANHSALMEGREGGVFSVKTDYINNAGPPAVMVHLEDVTERYELEKKLDIVSQKHHHQLLQADKMISLGILASGMAHEINNPNNSIMLNVSVLQKAWNSILPILDEYFRDKENLKVGGMKYNKIKRKMPALFNGLLESSKKIQRIVSDLKYFSGKDLISLKNQVDMESVVKSAISLTQNMINKSTRNFKAVYEKYLPNVMGNFQNLEQVIINLVQNACQALENPGQGLYITVTFDRGQEEIVVAVRDEGNGIQTQNLKYIMEPFYTTKRSSGGTGLGLYVSSKIINDHGGSIDVASKEGGGTTVSLRLPAVLLSS